MIVTLNGQIGHQQDHIWFGRSKRNEGLLEGWRLVTPLGHPSVTELPVGESFELLATLRVVGQNHRRPRARRELVHLIEKQPCRVF